MEYIDLERIGALLRERNISAHVEQTGGGVATLCVGREHEDGGFDVMVGPGWFGADQKVLAHADDCYIVEYGNESYFDLALTEAAIAAQVALMLS
jgi:hypothetical protein